MFTGLQKNLASILLGVVAGLLVVNAYGVMFKPEPAASGGRTSAVLPEPEGTPAGAKRDDAQLARQREALDRKTRELTARENALEDKEKRRTLTKEELRAQAQLAKQRALDNWQRMLDEHAMEPVNAAWAKPTAAAFDSELDQLTTLGNFAVRAAECRSKSCAVDVEFPTFMDAEAGFMTLVNHNFEMTNCAVHVILPEPGTASAERPYTARYLFNDCRVPGAVAALDQENR